MNFAAFKYLNRNLAKVNLNYGLMGVAIGLLICVFESTITEKFVSWETAVATMIFSTISTLTVTNAVYLLMCYGVLRKGRFWQFVLVYLLGLVIGFEFSYWLVSLIFNFHYSFQGHLGDYRISLLIGFVVSTIIYFYVGQQTALNARLKEKELDLVKAKQLITQAELQTLQSKINPHFLYNALNSIASLIHEDAGKAEDMTLKLSRLFRYSINSPQENMAAVTEEMEIVNTYLEIEKIRFGDRLSFTMYIDKQAMNNNIPRFLIQPLVENALKHGLNEMASNGELKIMITREGENIALSIADNGKPFPAELNVGYGLQSTYDKLTLLYGERYEVQITNTPEKQIRILIPAML